MPSIVTLHLPFCYHVHEFNTAKKIMRAQRKLLNPSIGLTMCLIARWSCSTRLLRYFDCRILIGTSRSALIALSPAEIRPALVDRHRLRYAVSSDRLFEIAPGR